MIATRLRKTAKVIGRSILGERITELIRKSLRPPLYSLAEYRNALQSKRGLEIGGPSPMLSKTGQLAVYDVLGSLDNCLYSGKTIWTGEVSEGNSFVYQSGKPPGLQLICDATHLEPVEDERYDCVLGCHCLEHIANPILALEEWKRVLNQDGLLLLILPHKDGTFDWRRPVTPLAHMIEDYKNSIGEDDLTHLAEILELHDLSKDAPAGTKEQFKQRCLANQTNRCMHHHVFDTMGAIALVNQVGFKILHVDNLKPYHIIVLAKRTGDAADNSCFMEAAGEHWNRSPFPSDRKYGKG